MSDELKIEAAGVVDDGKNLVVTLSLRNESDTTLHVNTRLRALWYDPATRVLTVRLAETGLADPPWETWKVLPILTAVDPQGTATIVLRLSRYLTKLEPGDEMGPKVVQLAAHEAEEIDVTAAWSDKPFYPDPREKQSWRKQMSAWQRGEARTRVRRDKEPKGKEVEE